jgi:hypothetical protein
MDAVPFGCDACCGEDAVVTRQRYANGQLEEYERLTSESHLGVALRRCRECGQAFLFIFTEEIDWEGGNDPQTTYYLPVTPDEARALAEPDLSEQELVDRMYACCDGRRFLVCDWPSDAEESAVSWSWGQFRLR